MVAISFFDLILIDANFSNTHFYMIQIFQDTFHIWFFDKPKYIFNLPVDSHTFACQNKFDEKQYCDSDCCDFDGNLKEGVILAEFDFVIVVLLIGWKHVD